jgi:glycosyltransferase involved in cell wall biosynthesis
MSRRLRVLSLGFTRDLWAPPSQASSDSRERLCAYAEHLDAYHVVAHSLRAHRLPSPLRIGPTLVAHATNGRSAAGSWLGLMAVAERLRGERFDLVQSQDPLFTGSAGHRVARRLRLPHNVCVYGGNPFDPQWRAESPVHRLAAPLARYVLRHAAGVQVDGSRTRASLLGAGLPAPVVAIKPMVPHDLELFLRAEADPVLRRELAGAEGAVALFVGRLAPQKDFDLLLEVMARLAPLHPGLRLACVGDGPERPRVVAKTRARGLADRVAWLGARPRSEVARLMAACDVLVLTSRYEGFARVIMEAAAAARPVVTTDVSGADDGIRNGVTGRVVPVGDAQAFADAVSDLLRDPARAAAMGRAGRELIQELAAREGSPRRQIEVWEAVVERWASARSRTRR